jgi:hypothetical protein
LPTAFGTYLHERRLPGKSGQRCSNLLNSGRSPPVSKCGQYGMVQSATRHGCHTAARPFEAPRFEDRGRKPQRQNSCHFAAEASGASGAAVWLAPFYGQAGGTGIAGRWYAPGPTHPHRHAAIPKTTSFRYMLSLLRRVRRAGTGRFGPDVPIAPPRPIKSSGQGHFLPRQAT